MTRSCWSISISHLAVDLDTINIHCVCVHTNEAEPYKVGKNSPDVDQLGKRVEPNIKLDKHVIRGIFQEG